jgi:hypothetical protein
MNEEQNKLQPLLPAHSILERHFYLMVLSCEQCSEGPFELLSTEQSPDKLTDIWFIKCKKCENGQRLTFDNTKLKIDAIENRTSELLEVNPTDQPSELMDVGQWLALFYSILNAASTQTDKKQSQQLGYEATLCLEEALKFYQQDSDLPPANAIWNENSKEQLKEHPELLLRSKLLHMREKLPNIKVMRNALAKENPKNSKSQSDKKTKKQTWLDKLFHKSR